MKNFIVTLVAVAAVALLTVGMAGADANGAQHKDESAAHSHDTASPHGGQVTMTQEFHVEVAFDRGAVVVYLYDSAQNPISAENVSATATLTFRDQDHTPVTPDHVNG